MGDAFGQKAYPTTLLGDLGGRQCNKLDFSDNLLEQALLQAAKKKDAVIYKQDRYGVHYDVKFLLQTEIGSSLILSSWIIRQNETFPRLTNAYPVNK